MTAQRKASSAAARRSARQNNPQVHDIPRSVGGFVMRFLRPRLPVTWQYGWKWHAVQATWMVFAAGLCGYYGWLMWGKYTEEDFKTKSRQYQYVRDERGHVVDLSYKPLAVAGIRARQRAQRLLEDDD